MHLLNMLTVYVDVVLFCLIHLWCLIHGHSWGCNSICTRKCNCGSNHPAWASRHINGPNVPRSSISLRPEAWCPNKWDDRHADAVCFFFSGFSWSIFWPPGDKWLTMTSRCAAHVQKCSQRSCFYVWLVSTIWKTWVWKLWIVGTRCTPRLESKVRWIVPGQWHNPCTLEDLVKLVATCVEAGLRMNFRSRRDSINKKLQGGNMKRGWERGEGGWMLSTWLQHDHLMSWFGHQQVGNVPTIVSWGWHCVQFIAPKGADLICYDSSKGNYMQL